MPDLNTKNIHVIVRLIACLGRFIGGLLPFRNKSGLFFFFPFFHVGGAERVHSDIVNCFADKQPWVFFTKWSPRPGLLRKDFQQAARLFDWRLLLKYTYPLSAGLMAGFINRHPDAVVFGCNTLFFYKMIPWLAPHVRRIDLLHAFGGGAEDFSLPVVQLLDKRVVISTNTKTDLTQQYSRNNIVPSSLPERIKLIENRVDIPTSLPSKPAEGMLQILYVGRGTPEKRVHLVGRIARLCSDGGLAVRFTLIGDLLDAVDEPDRHLCCFTGEINDQALLKEHYDKAEILILTSSREGFPMVIMEAMAHGVIPIVTAVGGIPNHVRNSSNGFLIKDEADEDQLVKEFVCRIEQLCHDRDKMNVMSLSAYSHARQHFSGERFCKAYRDLLLENKVGADHA